MIHDWKKTKRFNNVQSDMSFYFKMISRNPYLFNIVKKKTYSDLQWEKSNKKNKKLK